MPERVEPWMMDEVKTYLERIFLESRVEYFPRGGGAAVMYRIEIRAHTGGQHILHQLWLDKSFFLRNADRSALRSALEGADLRQTMRKARDKIVELR